MVIVKGIRKVWKPDPVRVEVREASFFEHEPYLSASPRLANAFYLENVAYSWMRGTSEDIA